MIIFLKKFWKEEWGGWFLPLLLAIVFNVIAYLLTPKPKKAKPEAAKDLDDPVSDAGKPIPVVFGTNIIKGLDVLHFGDKGKDSFEVSS